VDIEELADERDEASREDEREPSVIELMNGPNRPSSDRQRTIVWICTAFISLLFVMTLSVIARNGLDILTIFTLVILGFILAALIGMLRYKGSDVMAQFDPPDRPAKKRRFRRASKDDE
jgi:xanthine/uracil permease